VHERLLSLRYFSDMTWWSGDARRSGAAIAVAALLAVRWPFQDTTLLRRLVRVGTETLRMCALAAALQWRLGHGAELQSCVEGVHAAFGDVSVEFDVVLDGKNKPHNAVVHMVPSACRIGVPSEFNGGVGIESVHPYGKKVYAGSSKKGEVQDTVAEAQDLLQFVQADLVPALSRAAAAVAVATADAASGAASGAAGNAAAAGGAAVGGRAGGAAKAVRLEDDDDDDDSEEDAVLSGTSAYATGSLVRSMHVRETPGPLHRLVALLGAAFPRLCAEFYGDEPASSSLHTSRAFVPDCCYIRRALKLRRDGVCNRRLPAIPDGIHDDPHSALQPCIQLLHNPGNGIAVPDPNGFCELLLVLSYDKLARPARRMDVRALRESSAEAVEELVLVRSLKPMQGGRNGAFVRCSVPGPPLADAGQADFKHFKLLPLSVVARPRAAFAAFACTPEALPEGALTPWRGPAVNVFLLV
jgi:hypothetical protein